MITSLALSRQKLYGTVIPACLIIIPFFFDMLTGLIAAQGAAAKLSPAAIYRGIISVIGLALLWRLKHTPLRYYVCFFFLVFVLANLIWATVNTHYSFAKELSQALKITYPWILAVIFFRLEKHVTFTLSTLLSLIARGGAVVAISIVAAKILGLGQQTYGDYSYGTKGVFIGQNDIGLVLVLGLTAATALFIRNGRPQLFLLMAVIMVSSLLLGTRTGLLGPAVVFAAFLGAALIGLIIPGGTKMPTHRSLLLLATMLAVASITIAVLSTSGLKTHHMAEKLAKLTEETPRAKLEAAGTQRLRERKLILTVFGEGAVAFKKHVARHLGYRRLQLDFTAPDRLRYMDKQKHSEHRVENDIYDVLGFYGIAQFLVVYAGLVTILLLAVRKAVRQWNTENIAVLILLLLYSGHSSLAGHAMFSAQAGTLIAPLFYWQLRQLSWNTTNNRGSTNT